MCPSPHHNGNPGAHTDGPTDPPKPWYQTIGGAATAGLLLIIAYYLWAEHRAHVIAFLPFAILLLCPLMHLFGPGHGGHGNSGSRPDSGSLPEDKSSDTSKGLPS